MAREVVIASASDWSDGSMAPVEVGEHRVAVCRVDGVFRAFDDHCPHAGSTLALGTLTGHTVECPRHEFVWDVVDGKSFMAWDDLVSMPVRVEGDDVILEVPDEWPLPAHLKRHPKRDELAKKLGYQNPE